MRPDSPDIFMSYARADNEQEGRSIGFVTRLENRLKRRLKTKLGREPIIVSDMTLTSGDRWNEELMSQLRSSRILFSIISPTYENSKFCDLEWKEFRKSIEDNKGLGQRFRFLPVMYETCFEDLREDFRERQINYRFTVDMSTAEFGKTVNKLAEEMKTHLKKIEERPGRSAPAQPLRSRVTGAASLTSAKPAVLDVLRVDDAVSVPLAEQRVFLGLPLSEEMEGWEKQIRQELSRLGHEVEAFPFKSYDTEDALNAKFDRAMATCFAAIHLIAETPGPKPGFGKAPVIQLQFEAARRAADLRNNNNQRFVQLFWTGPALRVSKIEDSAYRGLVKEHDYTNETVNEFMKGLREKLREPMPPPPPPPPKVKTRPIVCLIYESGDQDVAAEIKRYFTRTKGWHVREPRASDQKAVRQVYAEVFRKNECFLFYWGSGASEWFERHYDRFMEARSDGAAALDPKAAAVYFGSDKTDYKERCHWPYGELRSYDRFDSAALKDFERDVENSFR